MGMERLPGASDYCAWDTQLPAGGGCICTGAVASVAGSSTAAAEAAQRRRRRQAKLPEPEPESESFVAMQDPPQKPSLPLSNSRYPNLSFDAFREQRFFHQISLDYPGLQLIHERPYIFIVNSFLSAEECRILMLKSQRMLPQSSGMVGALARSGSRQSQGCILHPEEVPRFRDRIQKLTRVDESQLQPLKLSRYLLHETDYHRLRQQTICSKSAHLKLAFR